jgi:hypothetical protein
MSIGLKIRISNYPACRQAGEIRNIKVNVDFPGIWILKNWNLFSISILVLKIYTNNLILNLITVHSSLTMINEL